MLVDIKGSAHSSVQSFEVEQFSSAIAPVAFPEFNTFVSFVWALSSPSVTFDVTWTMLYTIDQRKTAPICTKPLTLSLVTDYFNWLQAKAGLQGLEIMLNTWAATDLQPVRVKNMLVQYPDKHQVLQTGFLSLCKELEWWWEKYCPNCLHQQVDNGFWKDKKITKYELY